MKFFEMTVFFIIGLFSLYLKLVILIVFVGFTSALFHNQRISI